MGSDPVEAAQIDMWSEHVRELKDKYKAAKARQRRQRGALGSATARLLQSCLLGARLAALAGSARQGDAWPYPHRA